MNVCSARITRRRLIIALALCGVALCGVAGCTSDADYRPDKLAMPQRFSAPATLAKTVNDGDLNARLPLDDAAWWSEFHDPVLRDLLDRADHGNIDLQIAAARLRIAADAVTQARSLEYPSLDIGAAPTDPVVARQARAGGNSNADASIFGVMIAASYEVDLWGRVRDGVIAAGADQEAEVFDADAARLAMRSAIANVYFEIRAIDEERACMERSEVIGVERLRLLQLRRNAGRIALEPVDEAAQVLTSTRAETAALGRLRIVSVQALASLLGVVPEDLTIDAVQKRAAIDRPAPPAGLPSTLLERRPDVRAAETRVVAAHARSAAAGTTQFPQFVLTAELGVVSGALHNFFSGSKPIAGIGPGITYSLFDAGRRSASADTEARRFDIAMLEYRKAAYVALSDVERALLGYQAATRAVQDASDASAAQTRAQDRTYAQFAAGRVSRLDLLNAQDKQLTLVAAESRAHRARLDSIVSLYLALGGGWVGASNTSPGAAAPAPH